MQHRLILLVPHPENFAHDLQAFHAHWSIKHAEHVHRVREVIGYIQNRPVDTAWSWDRFHGVAELFFDSADSEEQAWASEAWRTGLAPDEAYLLDIENGWSSVVADTQRVRDGRVLGFRVLAFGGDPSALPQGAGAATQMRLEEAPPVDGAADTVLAVFATDPIEAERIAAAVGGTSLVARGVEILDVPQWPWDAAGL